MNKKKSGVGAPNTNRYTTNNGVNHDKCFCTCFSTRINIWMNQILSRVLNPFTPPDVRTSLSPELARDTIPDTLWGR